MVNHNGGKTMNWRIGMGAVVALASSLWTLVTPVSSVQQPPFSIVNSQCDQQQIEQVEKEARLITVKILGRPITKRDAEHLFGLEKLIYLIVYQLYH